MDLVYFERDALACQRQGLQLLSHGLPALFQGTQGQDLRVRVRVGVRVRIGDRVRVGVRVRIGVRVRVGVRVRIGVRVRVGVKDKG